MKRYLLTIQLPGKRITKWAWTHTEAMKIINQNIRNKPGRIIVEKRDIFTNKTETTHI